jgi:hypothetical protein
MKTTPARENIPVNDEILRDIHLLSFAQTTLFRFADELDRLAMVLTKLQPSSQETANKK